MKKRIISALLAGTITFASVNAMSFSAAAEPQTDTYHDYSRAMTIAEYKNGCVKISSFPDPEIQRLLSVFDDDELYTACKDGNYYGNKGDGLLNGTELGRAGLKNFVISGDVRDFSGPFNSLSYTETFTIQGCTATEIDLSAFRNYGSYNMKRLYVRENPNLRSVTGEGGVSGNSTYGFKANVYIENNPKLESIEFIGQYFKDELVIRNNFALKDVTVDHMKTQTDASATSVSIYCYEGTEDEYGQITGYYVPGALETVTVTDCVSGETRFGDLNINSGAQINNDPDAVIPDFEGTLKEIHISNNAIRGDIRINDWYSDCSITIDDAYLDYGGSLKLSGVNGRAIDWSRVEILGGRLEYSGTLVAELDKKAGLDENGTLTASFTELLPAAETVKLSKIPELDVSRIIEWETPLEWDPAHFRAVQYDEEAKTVTVEAPEEGDYFRCKYNYSGLYDPNDTEHGYANEYVIITFRFLAGSKSPEGAIVWVNGKDIKDNKKTADVDETAYYKTYTYQQAGMFSGGKWAVMATTSDINTVAKFTALFDKGKLTAAGKEVAKNAKKLAGAKLKDGSVVVTAGKNTGTVNVWVYEVKKKNVVVDEALGIEPQMTTVSVLAAAGAPVFAEQTDVSDGKLASGKKAVTKLELILGDEEKSVHTLVYCDKKAAFDKYAEFTIENSDDAVATVSEDEGKVTVTAVKAGKTTVVLKNTQSGKTAKLTVTVKQKNP